jgi:hypothetical protein
MHNVSDSIRGTAMFIVHYIFRKWVLCDNKPMSDSLELLWDRLLSRQPDQVREAFGILSPAEQQAVLAHLKSMVDEPGWHSEQRLSTQAALSALVFPAP